MIAYIGQSYWFVVPFSKNSPVAYILRHFAHGIEKLRKPLTFYLFGRNAEPLAEFIGRLARAPGEFVYICAINDRRDTTDEQWWTQTVFPRISRYRNSLSLSLALSLSLSLFLYIKEYSRLSKFTPRNNSNFHWWNCWRKGRRKEREQNKKKKERKEILRLVYFLRRFTRGRKEDDDEIEERKPMR